MLRHTTAIHISFLICRTVQMRVFIHRNLSEESTSVEVTNCTVNPGTFVMKFYGPEASEFYAIVDMIRDGIDGAIRDKICTLPPLMREFIYQKVIFNIVL
ncbi:unnamed protein product [Meloidogyne enterolobii]|uniref:Uncharacterized protein n=3 Tax=Meloidogyne enterolobii TaxID=390850 RepID=A0ACB1BAD6_MELEN